MMLNDITEQSRPILAGSPAQIYVQIQKKNSGELLYFLYLKICYGNFKLMSKTMAGMKKFRDKKITMYFSRTKFPILLQNMILPTTK